VYRGWLQFVAVSVWANPFSNRRGNPEAFLRAKEARPGGGGVSDGMVDPLPMTWADRSTADVTRISRL
jgi:hypothetical protein